MKSTTALAVLSLALWYASAVQADTFGSGSNVFDIEFVAIGDPGNPADVTGSPNPAGAVACEYRMGKYEISAEMIEKVNAQSLQDGAPLNIEGSFSPSHPDRPARFISWVEAT